MFTTTLLLLAGAAMVAAQAMSTTASPTGPVVSLFLPDTDQQRLVASIVGSSGAMTTYTIACPEGTDASDCGYGGGVTLTEGPSSFHLSQTMSDFTASVDCTLTGSTAGVCTESYGGAAANFPGLTTTTLSASDITFFPVMVTAGLSAGSTLAAATTGTSSSSAASAGGVSLIQGGWWMGLGLAALAVGCLR